MIFERERRPSSGWVVGEAKVVGGGLALAFDDVIMYVMPGAQYLRTLINGDEQWETLGGDRFRVDKGDAMDVEP